MPPAVVLEACRVDIVNIIGLLGVPFSRVVVHPQWRELVHHGNEASDKMQPLNPKCDKGFCRQQT
jgi:hypothetical protein